VTVAVAVVNGGRHLVGGLKWVEGIPVSSEGGIDLLEELQSRIGHKFANSDLLQEALIQSADMPVPPGIRSNSKLAWLGDAVMNLFVSEHLYDLMAGDHLGALDHARQAIVIEESVAQAANELDLPRHLTTSGGRPIPPQHLGPRAMAQAFEAIVGALYLDAGAESARDLVRKSLGLKPRDRS